MSAERNLRESRSAGVRLRLIPHASDAASMSSPIIATPRRIARGSWFAAALLGASLGCAALPWPGPGPTLPSAHERDAGGWLDLRGAVHVHTRDSHDSPGELDDLADAARSAGIDWVALTEHTRPGEPPASGRIRGVTFIPGYELRAWGGSLLALGIDALPDPHRDPARSIAAIHAAGGVALIGHLERSAVTAEEFAALGVDGIEIANLHAAAKKRGLLQNGTLRVKRKCILAERDDRNNRSRAA